MMHSVVLVCVVFAAELTATTFADGSVKIEKARSLAETKASDKVADPAADLATIKMDKKTIESDSKKAFQRIKSDAGRYIGDEEKYLGTWVDKSANGIEKTTGEVNDYRETSVAVSVKLATQAQTSMERMNEEQLAITSQAEEISKLVEDRSSELTDDQDSTSSDNVAEFTDSLAFEGEELKTQLEETKTTLGDNTNEMKDRFKEIEDAIGETEEEDKEVFDEEDELADEVHDVNKELNDEIGVTATENTNGAEKVFKEATAAIPTFKALAVRENKFAEVAVADVAKAAKKEIVAIQSDEDTEAEGIAVINQDKASELTGFIQDSVRDLKDGATDAKKEDAAVTLETTSALLDAEGATAQAADQARTLSVAASDLVSDGNEALNKEIDTSDSNVLEMQSQLQSATANADQELETARSQMKATVSADLHQQVGDVEGSVNKAIGDLQKKVTDGTSTIQNTISSINSEAGTLGNAIALDTAELTTFKENLADSTSALRAVSETVKTGIAQVETDTKARLDGVEKDVTGKINIATESLDAQIGKAGSDISTLAGTVYRTLSSKVAALKTDASDQLSRSARSIASATQRGENVMQGMQASVQTIGQIKDEIADQLPVTKKTVEEALNSMGAEIGSAEVSLKETKATATTVEKAQKDEMREVAGKQIDESRTKLQTQLGSTSSQIEEVMESLGTSVEDLKTASADDFKQGTAFQENMRTQVGDTSAKITIAAQNADDNTVQLSQRLGALTDTVNVAINQQEKDGMILRKTSIAGFEEARGIAQASADKEISAAKDAGRAEIRDFETGAAESLGKDMQRARGFVTKNEDELSHLQSFVSQLDANLRNAQTTVEGKSRNAQDKVKNLRSYQLDLKRKLYEAEGGEKTLLEAQKNELTTTQEQEVATMQSDEEKRLKQLQIQTNEQFAVEDTRDKSLRSNELSEAQNVEDELAGEAANVAGAVKATQDQLAGLEKGEMDMESRLQSEAGDVKAALQLGGDAVARKQKEEEAKMQAAMDGDLNMMGNLVNGFNSAKEKAGLELEDMDKEFSGKLNSLKGVGANEAGKLGKEVESIIKNAPNFGEMFTSDTGDAQDELKASQQRMDAAQTWANQALTGYEAKLNSIKKTREDKGAAIHAKESQVKRMVVDETEKTVNKMGLIASRTEGLKKGMQGELDGFAHALSSLGGVETDHDQTEVDEMEQKLNGLTTSHERLMSWKDRFGHQTSAWRNEVENQLRKLGRGIGDDNDELAQERLEQEMSQNDGLRQFQLRVEGQVAVSDRDQARQFSQLAGGMGEKVDGLLHEQEASSAKSAEEIALSEQELKQNSAANKAALEDVKQNEAQLEESAQHLQTETGSASSEMQDLFKLPKLTISEYNQNTDAKMDNLDRRVATSFVEEGSTLRTDAESEAGEEKRETDEIEALTSLNSELEDENLKLTHSNSNLESGLKMVEQQA